MYVYYISKICLVLYFIKLILNRVLGIVHQFGELVRLGCLMVDAKVYTNANNNCNHYDNAEHRQQHVPSTTAAAKIRNKLNYNIFQ